GIWPALVVCGVSFAAVQFAVSNYIGPNLVDIAGGLAAIICLTIFLRLWRPRETWHFPDERIPGELTQGDDCQPGRSEGSRASAGARSEILRCAQNDKGSQNGKGSQNDK